MTYDVNKVYDALLNTEYTEMERWELVRFLLIHQRGVEKCKIDILEIPYWTKQFLEIPVLQKVFAEDIKNG